MLIDFSKIEEKIVPNFKGGEGDFHICGYNDGKVMINNICIEPGTYNGMHIHSANCEIIYVIDGELLIKNDDGTEEHVFPGQVTYCPMGTGHSVIAAGDKPVHMLGIVPEQKL